MNRKFKLFEPMKRAGRRAWRFIFPKYYYRVDIYNHISNVNTDSVKEGFEIVSVERFLSVYGYYQYLVTTKRKL